MKRIMMIAAAMVAAQGSASAGGRLSFEPITDGGTVRYRQGTPTVEVTSESGAVQIIPLGLEHNRLTFGVAVLNKGDHADDFGIEDIHASVGGSDVLVLTRERLEQQAQRRSTGAAALTALATGVSAAAAASAHDHYTATTFTHHGTYRTFISAPSVGGQVAAAGITAGGAYTIDQIQRQLDATRDMLANEIVQTTTVEPGDSYGGRFVLATLPRGHNRWPQDVDLLVTFNGHDYPFRIRVSNAH